MDSGSGWFRLEHQRQRWQVCEDKQKGGGKGKKGDQWIQGYHEDSYQPSYYGEKGKKGKGKGSYWEYPPLKGQGQQTAAKGKFQGQPPWEAWMMEGGIPGKGPWGMDGEYHWIPAGPAFKGSYGTTLDGDRPAKGKGKLDGKGKGGKEPIGKGPQKGSQDTEVHPEPGVLPVMQAAADSGRVGALSKPMLPWEPVHPWTGTHEKPLRDIPNQKPRELGEAVGAAAGKEAIGAGALLHHFSLLSLWTCQCQVYHGSEVDALRSTCKSCGKANPFLKHIQGEKQAMEEEKCNKRKGQEGTASGTAAVNKWEVASGTVAIDCEMTEEELQEKHCEDAITTKEMEEKQEKEKKQEVLGVFLKTFGQKWTKMNLKGNEETSKEETSTDNKLVEERKLMLFRKSGMEHTLKMFEAQIARGEWNGVDLPAYQRQIDAIIVPDLPEVVESASATVIITHLRMVKTQAETKYIKDAKKEVETEKQLQIDLEKATKSLAEIKASIKVNAGWRIEAMKEIDGRLNELENIEKREAKIPLPAPAVAVAAKESESGSETLYHSALVANILTKNQTSTDLINNALTMLKTKIIAEKSVEGATPEDVGTCDAIFQFLDLASVCMVSPETQKIQVQIQEEKVTAQEQAQVQAQAQVQEAQAQAVQAQAQEAESLAANEMEAANALGADGSLGAGGPKIGGSAPATPLMLGNTFAVLSESPPIPDAKEFGDEKSAKKQKEDMMDQN